MPKLEHDLVRGSVDRDTRSGDGSSTGREPVLTLADVARDLLDLDPVCLAEIDSSARDEGDGGRGDPSLGLNGLIRRAMHTALLLRDEAAAAVRLMSEKTARAARWPDARTANVSMLIAWALVGELRKAKGLPTVPLMSPDGRAEKARPSGIGSHEELATASALFEAFERPVLRTTAERWARREVPAAAPAARLRGTSVASTNATIREVLGLEPRELADMIDRRAGMRAGTTFEADPEAAGRAGLLMLLRDAFVQVRVMKAREVDRIRLTSDVEAQEEGWADSRPARFATLVAAALVHGDPRDVTFLPPRDPLPEREDLLMAVAKDVFFFGSEVAFQELELLCDDDVRFGVDRGRDKARRLLWRVCEEHDPQRRRLRELPTSIADAMILFEAADSRGV